MKTRSKAVKVLGALVMIILFVIGLLTGFIVEKNYILLGLIFIAIAVFYGLSKLKPKSKAVKVLGGLVMIVLWIFYDRLSLARDLKHQFFIESPFVKVLRKFSLIILISSIDHFSNCHI